ncbi:hypothetical protein PF010_g9258 [Phytophthora fragariae]|uniref:Uncharacterized protein n=1 Tax=Phytophthora fragariae TaxID=53985 RepID=A0A6G0LDC4_9STRA|nr:hypothetical protein PF010_g9258 [Phytophthora fragariae]KAE9235985.1 hypothetical protein PF004_g8973 [Phytophthora fragariae]
MICCLQGSLVISITSISWLLVYTACNCRAEGATGAGAWSRSRNQLVRCCDLVYVSG